ncbi:MAG: hypothetical protein II417_00455, partial [Elusimicrobia bacterium]|nr:hypothetical protein [Elusimicrobiota bacterium]
MNLKKLIVFLVLSLFCIPTGFVFAGDLEIDEGKNLLFDLREINPNKDNLWYGKNEVYDNVNIGAGTKVFLDSEWEYIYKGFVTTTTVTTQPNPENPEESQEVTETKINYQYAKEENLATLSIKENGRLILNSGSELSLRNEYSLVKSSYNVSIQYQESKADKDYIYRKEQSLNKETIPYVGETFYENRAVTSSAGISDLFTGNIVFENGDSDTKLTFRGVSEKNSDEFILPVASTTTAIRVEEIPTAVLNNQNNRVHMYNNLEIHSNRSVINVDFDGSRTEGEWDPTCGHVALGGIGTSSSTLSGDGTIVKQGAGVLYLLYDDDSMVDGMGLTGTNTGYAWRIEEGRVRAVKQESLGKNAIYIDSQGALSLARYSDDQIINPKTIISEIKSETGLTANTFENAITSSDGQIIIASNGVIELKGKIDT